MLPSVVSLKTTASRMVLYTVILWALTLVFSPVAGMGHLYLGAAVILGGLFTFLTVKLYRNPSNQLAMKVFTYSITYITLLFGAMALDQFIRNA